MSGFILLLSVLSTKLLNKYGVPTLIIFLSLGMLLGSEGIGGIHFDDFILTQDLSSLGLMFIIFYEGFILKWRSARSIAAPSILLSSVGVLMTAILLGLFSHWLLNISIVEGLLLGAVVSSTDAASVLSILKTKDLHLPNKLASMLEMESGSNDPMSYLLTLLFINILVKNYTSPIILLLFNQVFIGGGLGFLFGFLSVKLLKKIHLDIEGLYPIYVMSIVALGYSISNWLGGNGFLTVYILGIIIGNSSLPKKYNIIKFFDGLSWLMQIVIFFTLGLLVTPSELIPIIWSGIAIALFLMIVARPLSVIGILSLFKIPIKHQLFISWVGLRGAASIVFATYALSAKIKVAHDIFNIVFFIALFSVIIQGALMPVVAKKLDLFDHEI